MNIKKLSTILISSMLAATSIFADASILSGPQSTSGGKAVDLQGLEWMSLDHTAGLSREDVELGFTDRYDTVWGAGEWIYASRKQTEAMLGSLWGGTYNGHSADNADGAEWFLDHFGGLAYDDGYGEDRISRAWSNDNWTEYEGISDSRRGFLMGNALVVGIVKRLAGPLAKLIRVRSEQ